MNASLPRCLALLAAAALPCAAAAQGQCQPFWQRAYPQPLIAFHMITFDDGSGSALYIFDPYLPATPIRRMRQDGQLEDVSDGLQPWSQLSPPIILDDGSGPALYVRGKTPAMWEYWVARWNGQNWQRVLPGLYACETQQRCRVPHVSFDDGSGMAIYGGYRLSYSERHILRWNVAASEWMQLSVANEDVQLHVFDLGDGPGLYALGRFTEIGGVQTHGFARWNGSEWIDVSAPGAGVCCGSTVVYDDGTGPAIYTLSGGPQGVKKWTGSEWILIGASHSTGWVGYNQLYIFDDGSGPALYLAGLFGDINGVPARTIARYDGTWSGVGGGVWATNRMGSLDMDIGPSLIVSSEVVDPYTGYLLQWVGCPNCYANCDGSTVEPRLNVDDFICFINKFAVGDRYANCTGTEVEPYFSVQDFACFLNKFAQGCP
jgi:hypothetical protein